jgi:hypothetical protein
MPPLPALPHAVPDWGGAPAVPGWRQPQPRGRREEEPALPALPADVGQLDLGGSFHSRGSLFGGGIGVAASSYGVAPFAGGVPGAYPQLAGLYGGPSMWAFGGEGER